MNNIIFDKSNSKLHFADLFINNKLALRIRFCLETKSKTIIYRFWNSLYNSDVDKLIEEISFK
jgi:hypothetical protein